MIPPTYLRGLDMPYICSVMWAAKPGSENTVLEALIELASPSREEPGIIYYQPYQDHAEAPSVSDIRDLPERGCL
jgi:quinol monooxygenase YgiN